MRFQVALRAIAADTVRFAVALSAVVMMATSMVTFGSWSAVGSGYAKPVTASNLTINDVVGTTVANLYPGGTGDVKFSVTNPNAFPITITDVTANGAATSDNATCTASTGVTFTTTTGLTQAVGANATVAFTLAGKAAMTNASVNACQGAIFTLPVTLAGTDVALAPTAPVNIFTMKLPKGGAQKITTQLHLPGPGKVVQVATTPLPKTRASSEMTKTARRMTVCTARKTVAKAGTVTITCRLTAKARAARKMHSLRVRLVTTFTPTGRTATSVSKTLVLKQTQYRPPPVTG